MNNYNLNNSIKDIRTGIAVLPILFTQGCDSETIRNSNLHEVERPNIIIIMFDDMGYSDLGSYGGEISTPNMDKLAYNGLRFTQFYNAARCCPTRAALLTGMYQHRVGMQVNGHSLGRNGLTIAEVLKSAGYQTGMAGKWHLSETFEKSDSLEHLEWLANRSVFSDFAPLETYPTSRGFDEFYGTIWGVVNFYDPFSLVENEKPVMEVPENFYITNYITEKSIEMLYRFSKNDEPFFLFVSHLAPHWPLHALEEDVKKYQGMYDEGWEILRNERYDRMAEIGIINPFIAPNALNESGLRWEDVEDKPWETSHMEAHAAMIDRADQGIGKIIEKLKQTGEYENTIIFILSDNGASPERIRRPGFDRPAMTRDGRIINYPEDGYEKPWVETTFTGIGRGWAGALNTPFRYWKIASHHGGIASPFIVHWPAGFDLSKGFINYDDVIHVMDIMPTCIELAGAEYPEYYNGNSIDPLDGKSFLPVLLGNERSGHDVLFWEHEGRKALRVGNWKIVAWQGFQWELFDLNSDITETNNLAEKYPERVEKLAEIWHTYANEVGYDPNATGPTR